MKCCTQFAKLGVAKKNQLLLAIWVNKIGENHRQGMSGRERYEIDCGARQVEGSDVQKYITIQSERIELTFNIDAQILYAHDK